MLEPLWEVLEQEKETNLYEAIKKAGLPETEAVEGVKEVLAQFTKKWEWVGTSTFTNKGFKKKVQMLAESELFYYIMLLHKCRDTPPRDPSKGGGLPLWFEKLEVGLVYLKPNHPTYHDLVKRRNGELS